MVIPNAVAFSRGKVSIVALTIVILSLFNLAWNHVVNPDPPQPLSSWESLLYSRQLSKTKKYKNYDPEARYTYFHDLENYYIHIPKTAGYYVFGKIEEMVASTFEHNRPHVCNIKMRPLYTLDSKKCQFCFTEQTYSHYPKRTYTMIRNPRDHVISQYFHCAESKEHYYTAKFMPSLDEWLEAWVLALDNETKAEENEKFKCYDPRNKQTSFVYSHLANDEKKDLETLDKRFEVIAPFERMDTSICVIFIQFSGRVPDECVCASEREKNRNRNSELVDHGVKHHGSSFVTTAEQDGMIAKITTEDVMLHKYTNQLFEKKLKETEEVYGITVC
mmetsp:Transcript_15623/g.31763  ORF Transcript_15623/g.31763 Transcript_15623/m.31763 type:complete len:332 (+) Transcript_15623:104-1099(+)